MKDELLHKDLTDRILNAFYKVYNVLGGGFLEKVYENAMAAELRKMGFKVEQQKPIKVFYEGAVVGDFFADLVVDEKVILELKAASSLNPAHDAQLGNYLKATDIEVGMLLNFGEKPEFKRRIYTNDRKKRR
jgi:GxxExxY protein